MKKTRTGGYLRQLLHLIGQFIEDKQNGKRSNFHYFNVIGFIYTFVFKVHFRISSRING
jgi:hypothetical protein